MLQIATVLAIIISAGYLLWGCISVYFLLRYIFEHFDWQEPVLTVVLLSAFPVVLGGLRRPRLAGKLLIGLSAATAFLPLTITNRTGDGIAAMLVGSLLIVALPLALIAAIFWWRAKNFQHS